MEAFEAEGIRTELIPGISSAAYFCSRLKIAWEDVKLMSVHGRSQNLIAAVRRHFRTFTLLGGKDNVQSLCERLLEYGLGGATLYVGERLHYPQERITKGSPEELREKSFDGLCVALVENPDYCNAVPGCIPDEEFIRGEAPMTKCEVRGLSVEKLGLSADSVVWDVGAGTGSVTVELALRAYEGQVWAIERKPEAAGLIGQNCGDSAPRTCRSSKGGLRRPWRICLRPPMCLSAAPPEICGRSWSCALRKIRRCG